MNQSVKTTVISGDAYHPNLVQLIIDSLNPGKERFSRQHLSKYTPHTPATEKNKHHIGSINCLPTNTSKLISMTCQPPHYSN